ncbi:SGNH/GDSL hydrolase family protein [Methylobacterium sp. ID0610]|uniref:SGNH/GDSL hydrolase family protein n=1 Tax=Methylobacterium carpenticola TaxID=3344827 RepID=UPI0036AFFC03
MRRIASWLLVALLALGQAAGLAHAAGPSGSGVAASALIPTPASRICGQMGDSRTQNGGAVISGSSQPWSATQTEANTPVSKRSNGYQFWVEFLTYGRIQLPLSLNFGVTGDTAVNMFVTSASTRLDVAIQRTLAAGGSCMVLWAGTNDWTGGAAYTDVINAYEAAITKARAAGLLVIFITDTPRGHSSATSARLSTTNLKRMLRAVQWLRDQRNRPGVYIVDGMRDLADPASTVGDWRSSDLTSDGTHLTAMSAALLGQQFVAIANALHTPAAYLPAANSDLYDATDNPLGIITANPMVDGTGGSLGGSATGQVATGWSALYNNLTGYTLAYSKETVADPDTGAPKVWQALTMSGTPTVANTYAGATQTISLATYPVGTRLQVVCEVMWDAGLANIEGIRVGMEGGRTNAPNFWLVYAGSVGAGGKPMDGSRVYRGLMATEPYTLASDINSVSMQFRVSPIQNAAITAKIYWRACGTRIVQ